MGRGRARAKARRDDRPDDGPSGVRGPVSPRPSDPSGAGGRVGAVTWVPDSCTLPTVEQPLRVAEFDDLFATAVRPAERVGPAALRLHLRAGAEVAATARELVARETGCCSFFAFDVRPSPNGTELEVRVPESHTAVLDAMQQRAEAARVP